MTNIRLSLSSQLGNSINKKLVSLDKEHIVLVSSLICPILKKHHALTYLRLSLWSTYPDNESI